MFRSDLTSFFAVCLVLAAVPILASDTLAADAESVPVELTSYAFTPELVEFESGKDYVLELKNSASGGHNFSARDFFDAASIHPEDSGLIRKGRVELSGGETVKIRLKTGAAATYKLNCSRFLHSGFGMKGQIVVR
ncbi:Cupredoxin-like domain-containing protein [Parasphingorhabdus marina DSM 22363]|uniref:Cupredoxin-like domain-containing protein n=1 Tax=Parasphingorhabdus marina DSM 22363 TaxID=1123272 RepID=A0A1N6G8D8_9SPHN|nr:cupredoxin domain-containing protein [Parasphingorhabdus marina]SIO03711.1 Cupredoxin-like domain-containing protein [Parasphingorhabdus marina DSM 22363]